MCATCSITRITESQSACLVYALFISIFNFTLQYI